MAGTKRSRASSSSPSSSDTATNNSKKPTTKKKKSMWSSKKKRNNNNNLSGINESAAEKMFAEIADEDDPTTASMEGIALLGQKLGMDVTEDIRILVLLWKMGCREKPGQISKQEWMAGCAQLSCDSWSSLEALVPSLETGFLETTPFKEFYKFCFQFNRQGTHRTLDKELVVALLQLVLKDRVAADRVDSFGTFLQGAAGYTRITLDQWTSFLDFCHECPDLSAFDESTSAWPVLIDEYVEYMEKQEVARQQAS